MVHIPSFTLVKLEYQPYDFHPSMMQWLQTFYCAESESWQIYYDCTNI